MIESSVPNILTISDTLKKIFTKFKSGSLRFSKIFSSNASYFSRAVCLLSMFLGIVSEFCSDNTYKEQDGLAFCRLCLLILEFVNGKPSKKAK